MIRAGKEPQALDAVAQGATGAGIRFSDCEYAGIATPEDLMDRDTHPEPGQTPHPDVAINGWDEHGTAAVGQSSAVVNGYGLS